MTTIPTTTTTQTPSSVQYHGRRDLRAVVGMTAATLALLGSVAFWQVRLDDEPAPATIATTHTSDNALVSGQLAPLVPVSDVEMYSQWQAQASAALPPVEPGAVSDQEMYGQWQQRMSTPAGQPGSNPGS